MESTPDGDTLRLTATQEELIAMAIMDAAIYATCTFAGEVQVLYCSRAPQAPEDVLLATFDDFDAALLAARETVAGGWEDPDLEVTIHVPRPWRGENT